jgi:hypothetical protein
VGCHLKTVGSRILDILKPFARNLNRGDSHERRGVIHMWTPPLARVDFVFLR